MNFTCATYNILHGYHRDLILKNIRFLIKEGADAICLQEAEIKFEKGLRDFLRDCSNGSWEMRSVHAGLGGNVATLWNAEKLRLRDMTVIPLPKVRLEISGSIPHFRKLAEKTNRVALVGEFEMNGHAIQIANTHLAWEGGSRHRLRQLRHLREALEKTSPDFRVVTGDFNTIAPLTLRRMHERRIEKTLGAEFRNAFPRLPWTYDLSFTDPQDGLQFMGTLSRAGVKLRRRLDYMFAKDMTVLAGQMHDLPGSDHRPLIATFAFLSKRVVVQ